MENSTLGLQEDGISGAPIEYIHLRHPSRVFPRVPRRALARLVIVQPDSSPGEQDKVAYLPVQKPTNRVKAATPPLHKQVKRVKTTASPFQKQQDRVKAATPPLHKQVKRVKTTASPLQKQPDHVKAFSPPLQKKSYVAKDAATSLQKKVHWAKAASVPPQKQTGWVKTISLPLQKESDRAKTACSTLWKPVSTSAAAESARPVEQEEQSPPSEKGAWTVRLLRLNPSLLKAHRAKAASLWLQKPVASKSELGPVKKYKARRHEECADQLQLQKKFQSKVKKEVLQWSEHEETGKKPKQPKGRLDDSAEKKWEKCAESKKHVGRPLKATEHQSAHSGEKIYICPECGKSYKYNTALINHQRKHAEEKLHKNSKYEETPQNTFNFSRNKKIHRTVKPMKYSNDKESVKEKQNVPSPQGKIAGKKFTCSECGKHFSSLAMMLQHQKVHTREKTSMCNICGKTFSKSSHLLIHRRVHTGYFACNECGKSFNALANLKIHQMKHKGANPYTCNECGKSFKIPSYLQLHQRIHTLEKWRDRRLSNSKRGNQRSSKCGTKTLK